MSVLTYTQEESPNIRIFQNLNELMGSWGAMNFPAPEAFKAKTQVRKQLRQEWTGWDLECQDTDLYRNSTDNVSEFGEEMTQAGPGPYPQMLCWLLAVE